MGSGGLKASCKSCVRITSNKYRDSLSGFLKRLVTNSIVSASGKKRRNLTSTLTEDKLRELIKYQNGKCAISDATLVFKAFSNSQASVDRIKDHLGYVDGNCRLVCLEFNTAVKWSRALLLEAVSLSGIPPKDFENETSDLEMVLPRKRRGTVDRKWTQITKNGVSLIFCHGCSETKPREDFNKDICWGCKSCQAKNDKKRASTWRGALKILIKTARKNTKIRNRRLKNKNPDASEQKFLLTYLDLVKILKDQGGMCAYSQIALSPKMGDWKVSLERKDVKQGYSPKNVCLICQRFNGTDCTKRADGTVDGSGGWSREKFLQYAQLVSA